MNTVIYSEFFIFILFKNDENKKCVDFTTMAFFFLIDFCHIYNNGNL